MPRPRKWRTVCCLPESNRFGPLDSPANAEHVVQMMVDEYETIRLIDLEGFTQEECAGQMNIARTTVQGIYNDARRKLAESLVNGKCYGLQEANIGCAMEAGAHAEAAAAVGVAAMKHERSARIYEVFPENNGALYVPAECV